MKNKKTCRRNFILKKMQQNILNGVFKWKTVGRFFFSIFQRFPPKKIAYINFLMCFEKI